MHVVIAYDVCDHKTRNKIFAFLKEKGIHTQRSIFECEVDATDLAQIQNFLRVTIDGEKDSVLLYPLCRRCTHKVTILGQGIALIKTHWVVV